MKQLIVRRKPIEPVYTTKLGRLFCGDVIEVLKSLPSKLVQCCVTSPPYWGLRDYGTATWVGGDPNCNHKPKVLLRATRPLGKLHGTTKHVDEGTVQRNCHCGAIRIDKQLGLENTPEEYVAKIVKVFCEVRRVLRDDGTLWLNLGDSYWSNTLSRKDPVEAMWGNRPASNLANGRDAIPQNNKRGGLGKRPEGLKPKDLVGIPWMVAFALRTDGWYLRQDIIWHKPNSMPESITDRCTKAHEYLFLLAKSQKYYYDSDAIKETSTFQSGLAASFKRETKEQLTPKQRSKQHRENRDERVDTGYRNKRSVWTINTEPCSEAHFAIFPIKLIEPCIKAGTKKGDIVLDPFMGSGTTGYLCEVMGRRWVGIELNPDYCKLAKKRIDQEACRPKLL